MTEEVTQDGQANTDPASVDDAATVTDQDTGAQGDPQQDVPLEYEAFTAPEGMELNAEILAEFIPFAQGLKLDQASAQQLVDMGAKLAAQQQEQSFAAWEKQKAAWKDQSLADKEIGGQAFEANLGIAKAAIDKFGDADLTALLEDSGIGNHPAVLRFAHRIGKAISSDSVVVTGGAKPSKSAPEVLYPTMAQQK